MTIKQRNPRTASSFGLWLRKHDLIDSRLGFRATDFDFILYMWGQESDNQITRWMFLEEKIFSRDLTCTQRGLFSIIDGRMAWDNSYNGFHLIQFAKTCFGDGAAFLDYELVTEEEMIRFLAFQMPHEYYHSLFFKLAGEEVQKRFDA